MRGTRFATLMGGGLALLAVCATAAFSASTAGPTFKPGVIKVGLITTYSNAAFQDPQLVAADRAAVRGLNSRGGLAGHKVVLDFCDDQANPNQAVICARQMVADKVAFMAGEVTLQGSAVAPILQQAGIPVVGAQAISTAEYNSPNYYLFSGGSFFAFQINSVYAAHMGYKTSIVSSDNSTSTALRSVLEADMSQAVPGAKYTATALVSPTQADFAPIVATAQSGGSNAAVLFLALPQTEQFYAAANASGAHFDHYFSQSFVPAGDLAKVGGSTTINKVITAQSFPPLSTSRLPVMKRYRAELQIEQSNAGNPWAAIDVQGAQDFQGWLSFQAVEALVKAKHITKVNASTITKGLNTVKKLNMQNAIPPWTPSTPGPANFTRVSNQAMYIIGNRGKNSVPYLITPKPITLAQAIKGKFK
jgi:ABC-type branched-subunit amino acid transport system substrate-binding protein